MREGDVFLYLLGAGASCNALPLAYQFAGRLTEFAKKLRMAGPRLTDLDESDLPSTDPLWGDARKDLVTAIEWLAEESSHHASVDTFAKKLYFRKDGDALRKLKAALSAYLVAEQAQKNVDLRYDSFLASVAEFDDYMKIRLPRKLRILTWNYDTQLEKAFYGFCGDQDTVEEKITNNRRQIHRINGCCGREFPGNIDKWFHSVWDATPDAGWKAAIGLYKEYMEKPVGRQGPDICFAWENSTTSYSYLEEVSVLVVIGYSFPYFNRKVDDLIFKQFGKKLRKVYLQCPEVDHASVIERLKLLLPPLDESIISITSTDLFYIPDEF
ncbi:MAG: hypothetical protein NTV58_05940 [Deltaproteobacteria bacterium]|nr:hypothetical protein [Deltaproteobacteria bacterium]